MRRDIRTLKNAAGFTLIELMISITIMLILIGISVVGYTRIMKGAKEAVLMYDLRAMREMIDHYTDDRQAAPQSLEALSPGYLHEIPVDPMTHGRNWDERFDQALPTANPTGYGVVDVKSKSAGTALDGTKYSDW